MALRGKRWGKETVAKFLGGQVIFNLTGDRTREEYTKDLDGIIARSTDMTSAMKRVGLYLMGATSRTFKAEGRPRRWQALSPMTIADRRRQGFGDGPILRRTGTLERSLTQPGARGSIFEPRPRSLRYGSRLNYFEVHQKGIGVPKRVMLIIQRQDKSQISRILNTYSRTGQV